MNRHLSSEEISQWLLNERTPAADRHLEACVDCRAEVTAFKTTLWLFRESARNWADRQLPPELHTLRRIKQARYRGMLHAVCLAIAMTVLCALGGISMRQRSLGPVMPSPSAEPVVTVTDAVLLERVDAQISQNVPSSLAPLDKALSWENMPRESARR